MLIIKSLAYSVKEKRIFTSFENENLYPQTPIRMMRCLRIGKALSLLKLYHIEIGGVIRELPLSVVCRQFIISPSFTTY
jgi:hypothetical protein